MRCHGGTDTANGRSSKNEQGSARAPGNQRGKNAGLGKRSSSPGETREAWSAKGKKKAKFCWFAETGPSGDFPNRGENTAKRESLSRSTPYCTRQKRTASHERRSANGAKDNKKKKHEKERKAKGAERSTTRTKTREFGSVLQPNRTQRPTQP